MEEVSHVGRQLGGASDAQPHPAAETSTNLRKHQPVGNPVRELQTEAGRLTNDATIVGFTPNAEGPMEQAPFYWR